MRRKSSVLALLAFIIGGLAFSQPNSQDRQRSVIPEPGKAYAGSVATGAFTNATALRKFQAAKPATEEQLKKLGQQVDQLAKELAALKALSKRLEAAEKGLKDLAGLKGLDKRLEALEKTVRDAAGLKALDKRLDTLEKAVKDAPALKALEKRLEGVEKGLKDVAGVAAKVGALEKQVKTLDKLKDVPGRLDKIDTAIKNLGDGIKKVEDGLKKLDPLPGQVKTLEGKVAKLEEAVKRIEPLAAALKAAEGKILKLEKAAADSDGKFKDLNNQLKAMSERLDKATAGDKASDEKLKQLEDRVAREKEAREKMEKAVKDLEDRVKKLTTPDSGASPGSYEVIPCPTFEIPAPCLPYCPPYCPPCFPFAPATGYGCFGECFPVITPTCGWGMGSPYCWGTGWPMGGWDVKPAEPELPSPTMPPARNGGKRDGSSDSDDIPTTWSASRTSFTPARSPKTAAGVLTSVQRRIPKLDRTGLTAADADRLFWKAQRLYLQRNSEDALALLNVVVELSAEDARYWYFKSLSEEAVGQTEAAATSLKRAAALHLRGKPSAQEIGRALERVQGERRKKLREGLEAARAAE